MQCALTLKPKEFCDKSIKMRCIYMFRLPGRQSGFWLLSYWRTRLATEKLLEFRELMCHLVFKPYRFDTMKYLCYVSGSYLVAKRVWDTINLKFCTWLLRFNFFIVNIYIIGYFIIYRSSTPNTNSKKQLVCFDLQNGKYSSTEMCKQFFSSFNDCWYRLNTYIDR